MPAAVLETPAEVLDAWMRGELQPRWIDASLELRRTQVGPRRRLTERERDVLRRVCDGDVMKAVAHDLGITRATAAGYFVTARRKMGARTRAELVFWGARLARQAWDEDLAVEEQAGVLMIRARAQPSSVASLSAAERRVAELVARGMSNTEIARARNVSARTVANQLARMFRKSSVFSRFELVALT
jgi:DNA-binding CsgD family transcriptional regulator